MEFCDICGKPMEEVWEAGKHKVCTECKNMLQNNIGQKCLSCGSYGFIPINPQNIQRIQYFIGLSQSDIIVGNIIVIWESCPACGGIQERKEQIARQLHS